jgi:hypothetical protein
MPNEEYDFSKLHKESLDRLQNVEYNKDTMLRLFALLLKDAEYTGQDTLQLMMGLIGSEDVFVPGTYVPEVWLVLRKVND